MALSDLKGGGSSVAGSGTGVSSESSYPSTSASAAAAQGQQFAEIMSAISSLTSSVNGLQVRVKAVEAKTGPTELSGGRKCWICGSTDHVKDDCPRKDEKKAKKDGE